MDLPDNRWSQYLEIIFILHRSQQPGKSVCEFWSYLFHKETSISTIFFELQNVGLMKDLIHYGRLEFESESYIGLLWSRLRYLEYGWNIHTTHQVILWIISEYFPSAPHFLLSLKDEAD